MSRIKQAPFDVRGRTVFITGAARGIGAATAERLHRKGANVALVGLEPEKLQELAARLGERAEAFEADVTDFEALTRAVEGTVARFGGIDVAIANAGVAFTGSLINAPVEQIERTLAVNLLGVWRTDRAVIEQLIARRGYLLNISSLSAIVHPPMIGAYAAAKSGVDGLSDSLRAELAPSGVQVGCAYFGFLDTDLVRAGYAQPSAQVVNGSSPAFIRNPAPVSKAIDAIERGIERRSARVWAPRWVGPTIALRGLLQPLVERRVLREPERLAEAIRLADPASSSVAEQDPLLGVAAQALKP
ncbi:MAG TPA: short-chain dehydrogenase/reductase [Solirubrobacteraceae bacterium]|jgi:NAD(P)-dependent dehydrogenase (short-subunit alcohol dehydrogenase family)|nr:short-chain dehydrogenase/reductase [Solirubrobacteraceae bacterium]